MRPEVRSSIQERALAMARTMASRVSCLSVGVAAGRCRTLLTERNAGVLQGKVMTVAWTDDVAWPSPPGTSVASEGAAPSSHAPHNQAINAVLADPRLIRR